MATPTLCTKSYVQTQTNVDVTFSAINANTEATVAITLKGARVGMMPIVRWRTAMDAGIIERTDPIVTAADTITVYLRNITASPITPTANSADVACI